MTVYTSYEGLQMRERVIALGFFDGVHIGHRRIFEAARSAADKYGIPLAVFTFPAECAGLKGAERIYDTEKKLALLAECGVDEVILADFDAMRGLSAEQFIKDELIARYGCAVSVSGKDFRFGAGALGDVRMLDGYMREHGGRAVIVDDVSLYGEKVSTTAIKSYLAAGDIERANEMLGAPFFLEEEVTHGRGVGRTLGYPTLNCEMDGTVGLRRGVYRSGVLARGVLYPAITNVGVCPTFEERKVHAETYIPDFEGSLYGERIRVCLYSFIRDERRFESADELSAQISRDIENVRKEFRK